MTDPVTVTETKGKKRLSMWWIALAGIILVIVGSNIANVDGYANDGNITHLIRITAGVVGYLGGIVAIIIAIGVGVKRLIKR